MRLWREAIVTFVTEDVALHVAVLVDAIGDVGERQIRDLRQDAIQAALKLSRRLLQFSDSRLKLRDLDHQSFRVGIVSLLLRLADFL